MYCSSFTAILYRLFSDSSYISVGYSSKLYKKDRNLLNHFSHTVYRLLPEIIGLVKILLADVSGSGGICLKCFAAVEDGMGE